MTYHNVPTGTTNNNSNSNNNNNNSVPPVLPISAKKALKDDVPDLLIDYEKLAKKHKIQKVMFRDNIINRLLTILTTKNHPNALLVGEAGTGKTAIVKDLAVRLYEADPIVTAMLGDKTKIYELPLTNLVAGSGIMGTMEAKLDNVVKFISNPKNNAILYLDEIHQLTTTQSLKEVAEILKPALASGELHVIGSTTTQELKFWRSNPALTRRFSNLIVDELSNEQTEQILAKLIPVLQKSNIMVQVDPTILSRVVKTGNQYAKTLDTHRPDSAITVLDQAMAMSRLQSITLKQSGVTIPAKVTEQLIDHAGKQLVNNNNDDSLTSQTLSDLQTQFDENIIGQDKAKSKILKSIRSMILELTPQKRPYSFLFAGLTGTGKTEIAKQLAKVLFGAKDRFIYLNMTEYATDASLTTLIGSSRGYVGYDSAQPLPLDTLKSNPFQIVLLDEFEKASTDVKRLFMQALDEGEISYADGSHVDFSHAIVIGTTNSGTDKLSESHVGFGNKESITESDLTNALLTSFPPELLNRFEYIVAFDKITKEQYAEIVTIKYNQLRQEIKTSHPELDIIPTVAEPDMPFIQSITDKSYDALKNARPAERSVRHFVEDQLLNANQGTIDLTAIV
jgi:ATP-dependent Clp protease ATP-binding subunit ClpA